MNTSSLQSDVVSRRSVLAGAGSALAAASLGRCVSAAEPKGEAKKGEIQLGFSLYGTTADVWEARVDQVAKLGFTTVELPLLEGAFAAPETLSPEARAAMVKRIEAAGLTVSALMENVKLTATDAVHQKNLERLQRAGEWAATWPADRRPLIETVLGGKPGSWKEVRGEMLGRLADWTKLAKELDVVVCLKPHVGSAVQFPLQLKELVDSAASPHVRSVFDESHFLLQELALDSSLDVVAPLAAMVHLKDARGVPEKFEFLLPGAGSTDYVHLFGGLLRRGFRGPALVEVSAQLFKKPGFDMAAAAEACAKKLLPALKEAAARQG